MIKDQASADKDTTAAQRLALAAGGATKGAGDIVDNEVAADALKVGGKYHKIGSIIIGYLAFFVLFFIFICNSKSCKSEYGATGDRALIPCWVEVIPTEQRRGGNILIGSSMIGVHNG